jgi:hypothetical protein
VAIVSEYTREEWERVGGWRGVKDYIDGVLLHFSDEPEDQEEVEAAAEEGRTLVPWSYYRRVEPEDQVMFGRWILEEHGFNEMKPETE